MKSLRQQRCIWRDDLEKARSVLRTKRESRCLTQSVDPPLDVVAGVALLFAGGLMLVFGDHLPVGFPQVALTSCPLLALGDSSPQTFASPPRTLAADEGHDLPALSTQSQPETHTFSLLPKTKDHSSSSSSTFFGGVSASAKRRVSSSLSQATFLSQLMSVVGETPRRCA
jgi:hypothetical protein